MKRLIHLLRRGRFYREVQEEMRLHIELRAAELQRSGLSHEEAKATAQRGFGNVLLLREEAREMWGWNFLDTLAQDLRYALRQLRKNPVFTAVAVLTLALCIGANTAIFSVADAVILRPLGYRQPDRLFAIHEVIPKFSDRCPLCPVNFMHFRNWVDFGKSFDQMALLSPTDANLTGDGEPERVPAARVSPALFQLLGVQPRLGRSFLEDEDHLGRGAVVILSDELWRRRYGADPSIVGRTITIFGNPNTVIGVLPAGLEFPRLSQLFGMALLGDRPQLWVPLQLFPQDIRPTGGYNYACIGRLKPGVSASQALSELNALQAAFEDKLPERYELRAALVPLQDQIASRSRTGLQLLVGAVGMVLLIGCVNIANLLLARGNTRRRELAIRAAMGAGRLRLVRQMLVESALLAGLGCVLGIALAYAAIPLILAHAPADVPFLERVNLDWRVLSFALAISLFCGLLIGLLPAWRSAQSEPQESIRSESRSATASRATNRLLSSLVSVETGLSVSCLMAAGLLLHSFLKVLTVDPGFNPQRIVTVDLNLIGARYGPIEKRRSFVQSLVERMQAVPGVASVGVVNKLPLTGETNNSTLYPAGTILPSADLPIGAVRQVNPEYFSTMGIALRSGRFIERTDRQKQVAVVAASTAQRLWPGENPLGKRFSIGDPTRPPFEVIGVAPDVQTISLTQKAPATVYVPYWQQLSFTISLVAKTEQEPKSLAPSIRAAIRQIDPELPVPAFQTMAGIVADSVAERRFQMNLVILFGAAALLLASLGIYGVVSFSALQRTNEMGIRLALGARRRHVRGLVIGRSLVPVVAGLAAGTGLALALGRFLKSLLFGISASDPLTIGGAAAALALVAFGAASIPAQRLTRVDPAVALRHE